MLKGKGCGFVTFKLRATAEFAKEAMAEQALDHEEQINVRWAYDDPNPRAQATRLRNNAQQMLAAMEARGHLHTSTPEGAYPNPEDSLEPSAKRQREAEGAADGGGCVAGRPAPMTREEHAQQRAEAEAQLQAAAKAQAVEEAEAQEEAQRREAACHASRLDDILSSIDRGGGGVGGGGGGGGACDPLADLLRSIDGAPAVAASSSGSGEAAASDALDEPAELPPGIHHPGKHLPAGWRQFSDPASGQVYFVCPTGESTWRRPTSFETS